MKAPGKPGRSLMSRRLKQPWLQPPWADRSDRDLARLGFGIAHEVDVQETVPQGCALT
jgi:hypothetical protein